MKTHASNFKPSFPNIPICDEKIQPLHPLHNLNAIMFVNIKFWDVRLQKQAPCMSCSLTLWNIYSAFHANSQLCIVACKSCGRNQMYLREWIFRNVSGDSLLLSTAVVLLRVSFFFSPFCFVLLLLIAIYTITVWHFSPASAVFHFFQVVYIFTHLCRCLICIWTYCIWMQRFVV